MLPGWSSVQSLDLKELSESVQQQSTPAPLISPKRQIHSRFQLNLDKTIESCKAQLGINEISEDVYTAVERSDSGDSENSESSDSEYLSDDEHKSKNEPEDAEDKDGSVLEKEPPAAKKKPKPANPTEIPEELKSASPFGEKAEPAATKASPEPQPERDPAERGKPSLHPAKDKLKGKDEMDSPTMHLGLGSDSESELVIDLGDDHPGPEVWKNKKEPKEPPSKQDVIGKVTPFMTSGSRSPPEMPVPTRSSSQTIVAIILATTSTTFTITVTRTAPAVTESPVKKQRPLLPKETALAMHRVMCNSSTVQQKKVTQSPSTSIITLVTSTQTSPLVSSSGCTSTLTSSVSTDLPIATASADIDTDFAKYSSKMMDAIKGMMTEIYNNLSKNTTGSTIAEICRLRIEIKKLQSLHQQELSKMKHNLELTMAEMRQSLEWEWDLLIATVKKELELEKQQVVDKTKKKQWCAHCKKEAIFYCCWNTSYCDYPCQQAHWPEHMKSCTQSVSKRCDKHPASTPTTTDHQPHPNYPAQKCKYDPVQPQPAQLTKPHPVCVCVSLWPCPPVLSRGLPSLCNFLLSGASPGHCPLLQGESQLGWASGGSVSI
ncbi:LOW QUALITY PROTEIN: MYND-type zinc finger-containing chromatin reader ZMYND8-like [Ictidomys tridecemlineatus]